MTFLSWKVGLAFAGITIPLLLLLYFLKLRRQERKVSSTFLWKKAVQDLQVNAPFQKLRKNLLLFLQLLLLAALLFGIAEPIANFTRESQRNIVIMIDRSASMKTLEADGRTRLEHAQQAATEFVSRLPDNSNAMVIAFGSVPSVGCTFTDDKRRLEQAVRNIESSDERSLVGEALPLAIAYSTNLVDVGGAEGSAVPSGGSPLSQSFADIEFFSDGRIADAGQQFVTRGKMRFYRVGQTAENVGITAFDVRRDFERPGMLSVFVQVENFGPTAVQADITIALDGKPLPGPGSIRELHLGPARDPAQPPTTSAPASGSIESQIASAQNVIFEFHHESGGIVQVELHHDDALAVDNIASAPIDPPREVRVLAVSGRSAVERFFGKALRALEIPDVTTMTPEEYEKSPDTGLIRDGRSAFDLVLLDNHDTDRLPPGNYLFFGGVPKVDGVAATEDIEGQPIIFGRQDDPLMRNVNYDGLYVTRWRKLTLPEHALGLLEGPDSRVIALLSDPGHRYVICAFDLLDSNFPLKEAFPIFIQNAVGYLASGGLIDVTRMFRPGETLAASSPAGATEVEVVRPDGHIDKSPVRAGGTFTYARTKDAGVYRLTFNDTAKTTELFAANLLDPEESRILPNEKFSIGAEAVESVTAETKVNQPLWPYAVLAAIAILIVEWWVYNKRVMI